MNFQYILLTISNQTKINNQITAPELLVIDETERSLGTLSKEEALRLAQEKGLDLIEVAPTAKPPVARIFSYDKYRYQQEKKFRKQKIGQKDQEAKQVQISVRSAKNDLLIKAKRANKFLEEGRPVRVVMVLRGREKGNKDFAKNKLSQFLTEMVIAHKIITEPKFGGRGITIQIQKK